MAEGKKKYSGKSREEKMSEIQAKLENGVREIYDSDKYREYIRAMSKFPQYSINNCILIASQRPDASLVCGFRKWQNDFHRSVKKGEKGIMILAPVKRKADLLEPVLDQEQRPVLDENGNVRKEKVTREYASFRPVYVFDVSQTDGEPLPELAETLDGTVENFDALRHALEETAPVPISYEAIRGEVHGYYSPSEQKIVIDSGLPELQMVKTMIHEIAHATLKHGSKEDRWDRETHEVQAESVAYWVSQLLGLDTSEYSFGYITGWSREKDVPELKENLELIKTTADQIARTLEDHLSEGLHSERKDEKTEAPADAAGETVPAESAADSPRRRFHR